MSDKWNFYFTKIEDRDASIFVDLGIRDDVPDRKRPVMFEIEMPFLTPREDGLSMNDEADTLFVIEDALSEQIQSIAKAELVGRITTNGHRYFVYYGPELVDLTTTIDAVNHGFPNYSLSYRSEHDPEWKMYLEFLYPSPEEMQTILNLGVVDSLQKNGDDLSIPRMVDHGAYFPSAEKRDAFKAEILKDGYQLTNESHADDGRELPYWIEFSQVSSVEWKTMNNVTIPLFRLAEQFQGDYDGWGTQVQ
jgi:uncharacterized protein (TIGR01619 family)